MFNIEHSISTNWCWLLTLPSGPSRGTDPPLSTSTMTEWQASWRKHPLMLECCPLPHHMKSYCHQGLTSSDNCHYHLMNQLTIASLEKYCISLFVFCQNDRHRPPSPLLDDAILTDLTPWLKGEQPTKAEEDMYVCMTWLVYIPLHPGHTAQVIENIPLNIIMCPAQWYQRPWWYQGLVWGHEVKPLSALFRLTAVKRHVCRYTP